MEKDQGPKNASARNGEHREETRRESVLFRRSSLPWSIDLRQPYVPAVISHRVYAVV